jgi:hypothetical protein
VSSLRENPERLAALRHKMAILWGSPLNPTATTPRSIRKTSRRKRRETKTLRFSDDIDFSDDSSESLNARYLEKHAAQEGAHGPGGGKIVRERDPREMKKGAWMVVCLWEFEGREGPASFAERRWRMFGTRIVEGSEN